MDNKGKGSKALSTSLQNLNLNLNSQSNKSSITTKITRPQFPGNSFFQPPSIVLHFMFL